MTVLPPSQILQHPISVSSNSVSYITDSQYIQTSYNPIMTFAKRWRSSELQVEICHHYNSKVYDSGSPVIGDVIFSPIKDIRSAAVKTRLVGESKVHWENITAGATTTHRFLDLDMPIPDSAYPESGTFLAGETYVLPFHFIIPHELPTAACSHRVDSDVVRDHHLQVPPSMGNWEKDDMAASVSEVIYSIRTTIFHKPCAGEPYSMYTEAARRIKVIAPSPEQAPLNIYKSNRRYALTKTKQIRKGLLSGSLGQVTVAAAQAQTVHLFPDGRGHGDSSLPISLTFKPTALDVIPPQITKLSAKIRSYTWYQPSQVSGLPDLGSSIGEPFTVTVPVSVEPQSRLEWSQHLDTTSASSRGSGKPPLFHSTTLDVQFQLPTSTKTFLPTFHSCLISRTYAIHLSLYINNAEVELVVPIQIAIDAAPGRKSESPPVVEMVPAYS
ncbi:arrestin [Ilyonectria destructans]|nr:arrestin [Ilyonectria destructans]